MLNAFSIAFGCFGIQSKAEQEPQYDLMPTAALMSEPSAFVCQKDRSILDTGDQPFSSQAV
jgi:hypothetical protein